MITNSTLTNKIRYTLGMKKKNIFTAVLVCIVISSVIYVRGHQSTPITPELDLKTLQESGAAYHDKQGIFTFVYPRDYRLDVDDANGLTRISKVGNQQSSGTEMTDNVVLVLETIDLQGKSLGTFVDEQINEATESGSADLVQAKSNILRNNYPGFTYKLQGQGDSNTTFIQKNVESPYTLKITSLVHDPKQHGYQKELNLIISTLELLK